MKESTGRNKQRYFEPPDLQSKRTLPPKKRAAIFTALLMLVLQVCRHCFQEPVVIVLVPQT